MSEAKKGSLTVLGGPLAGARCVLPEAGAVTIGSAEGSTLRLDVAGVSLFHARVVIERGTVTVHQTGAERGLHVNDNPVGAEGTVLRNGDIVWLGHPGDEDVVMLQCIVPRRPVDSSATVAVDIQPAVVKPRTAAPVPLPGRNAPTPHIETVALWATPPAGTDEPVAEAVVPAPEPIAKADPAAEAPLPVHGFALVPDPLAAPEAEAEPVAEPSAAEEAAAEFAEAEGETLVLAGATPGEEDLGDTEAEAPAVHPKPIVAAVVDEGAFVADEATFVAAEAVEAEAAPMVVAPFVEGTIAFDAPAGEPTAAELPADFDDATIVEPALLPPPAEALWPAPPSERATAGAAFEDEVAETVAMAPPAPEVVPVPVAAPPPQHPTPRPMPRPTPAHSPAAHAHDPGASGRREATPRHAAPHARPSRSAQPAESEAHEPSAAQPAKARSSAMPLLAAAGFAGILVLAGLGYLGWRFLAVPGPSPTPTPTALAQATPAPTLPSAAPAATPEAATINPTPEPVATPTPRATPTPAGVAATPTPRPTPTPRATPTPAGAAPRATPTPTPAGPSADAQRAQQAAAQAQALVEQAEAAIAAHQYDAAVGHADGALRLEASNARATALRADAVRRRDLARRRFVPGQTNVQTQKSQSGGLAGFETGDADLRQAPDFQGRIEFEMAPASGLEPGAAWTLRAYVVNDGKKPIRVQGVTITAGGGGGPVTPKAKEIAPQGRALVGEATGTWRETADWSAEVTVTANKGDSLKNSLRWR